MAQFKGYLLKGTNSDTVFPSKYIKMDSWEGTPRQREYLKAYRDDNTRNLTKVAAAGRKSTFHFTVPKTNLADREVIKLFFDQNQTSAGDVYLEYWDDQDLRYRTGTFYYPNLKFKIEKHTDNDIQYNELALEFIEN